MWPLSLFRNNEREKIRIFETLISGQQILTRFAVARAKPRNYRRVHVSCAPLCVGGYSSGFTGAMAGFFSSAERFLKAEQKEIRSAERARRGKERRDASGGRANEIKEIGVISAWYPEPTRRAGFNPTLFASYERRIRWLRNFMYEMSYFYFSLTLTLSRRLEDFQRNIYFLSQLYQ